MPAEAKVHITVQDKTSMGLGRASKSLKTFGSSINRVGRRVSLFVTGPLLALGTVALKNAAAYEKQQVAFSTLLGDAEKAQKLLNQIEQFAATTPFQMPGLIDGSQRLLAFGIEAEDVIDKMRRLGDLAMGDQEKLSRLVDAFGKVASRGKATMRELNMFIYSGVPIVQELADGFGVTTEELFKLSQQGKITMEAVSAAVNRMTSEGGQFYGMTEKQSKTLAGLFSTLKDNLGMLGREIMTVVMPGLKQFVEKSITFIQRLRTMDDDTKKMIIKFAAIGAVIGPVIMGIGALAVAIGALISPVGLVIAAIAALGVAAYFLVKHWEEVSKFLTDLWLDIADFANRIFQNMKLFVMKPIREVLEFLLKIAESTKKVFKGISLEGLQGALDSVNGKIDESNETLERLREQGYRTKDEFVGFGQKIAEAGRKIAELAKKMKGFIVDGFDMGSMLGQIGDDINGVADALNAGTEAVAGQADEVERLAEAYHHVQEPMIRTANQMQRYKGEVSGLNVMLEKMRENAEEQTNKIFPYWAQGWEDMGEGAMKAATAIKEAFKRAIADLLSALSREALVRALFAIAKFQYGRAAAWFAASAAASAGAGWIRSLAQGGEFVTSGPEMIMVGDNPSGRERVRVEPLSGGEPAEDRVIDNRIYIDGQPLFKLLTRATKSGELLVHGRAVLT